MKLGGIRIRAFTLIRSGGSRRRARRIVRLIGELMESGD